MSSKPITYVLEMRVEINENNTIFFRELIYGYYSCLGKAKKDIDDMTAYAMQRGYDLKGYRIFTLPHGNCALAVGERFHVPVVQRAIQLAEM